MDWLWAVSEQKLSWQLGSDMSLAIKRKGGSQSRFTKPSSLGSDWGSTIGPSSLQAVLRLGGFLPTVDVHH